MHFCNPFHISVIASKKKLEKETKIRVFLNATFSVSSSARE